jgi:hypothetical protein
LRLFLRVLYVRSLQVVHASEMTGRFSALATVRCPLAHPKPPTPNKGPDTGGKRGDSRPLPGRLSTRPPRSRLWTDATMSGVTAEALSVDPVPSSGRHWEGRYDGGLSPWTPFRRQGATMSGVTTEGCLPGPRSVVRAPLVVADRPCGGTSSAHPPTQRHHEWQTDHGGSSCRSSSLANATMSGAQGVARKQPRILAPPPTAQPQPPARSAAPARSG